MRWATYTTETLPTKHSYSTSNLFLSTVTANHLETRARLQYINEVEFYISGN